jgi:hypothetical protein
MTAKLPNGGRKGMTTAAREHGFFYGLLKPKVLVLWVLWLMACIGAFFAM